MSLEQYRITDAAVAEKGVVAAPDRLTGTASENKRLFDRLVRESVKPAVNGVIDTLAGAGGAANVGASVTGVAGDNVQAILDGMLPAVTAAEAAAAESAAEAAAYARQAAAHTDLPITRGTSGTSSMVMGDIVNNSATGTHAIAEGTGTVASAEGAHAFGVKTIANKLAQHVFGECNVADPADAAVLDSHIEIVGNGLSDSARSNARTLDWYGNETLAGKLTLGAGPSANMDAATKQYVDTKAQQVTDAAAQTADATALARDAETACAPNLIDNGCFLSAASGPEDNLPVCQRAPDRLVKPGTVCYTNTSLTTVSPFVPSEYEKAAYVGVVGQNVVYSCGDSLGSDVYFAESATAPGWQGSDIPYMDRWILDGTAVLQDGSLLLQNHSTLTQKFEAGKLARLDSQKVVCSVLSVPGGTRFHSNLVKFQAGNVLLAVNESGENFSVVLSDPLGSLVITATEDLALKTIKLELGERQTLAVEDEDDWAIRAIPEYSEELARCQRIHMKMTEVTLPAPGAAVTGLFEDRAVGDILYSAIIIEDGTNTDTIIGYGLLTYTGTPVFVSAYKKSDQGYYYVNVPSGTMTATKGAFIVRYTLADGT